MARSLPPGFVSFPISLKGVVWEALEREIAVRRGGRRWLPVTCGSAAVQLRRLVSTCEDRGRRYSSWWFRQRGEWAGAPCL